MFVLLLFISDLCLTFKQHCAQTLLDFNGGASCVQIYVNQHDFFISRNRVQELSEVESGQL
jgi:exocyst complex component 5